MALLASIPQRGNSPEGQDRPLWLLGPRRPHLLRRGIWRRPPHILPPFFVVGLALFAPQGVATWASLTQGWIEPPSSRPSGVRAPLKPPYASG